MVAHQEEPSGDPRLSPLPQRRRRVAAVVAAVLLLTGCSADGPVPAGPAVASSDAGGVGANAADRHFVTRLGPHHDQAVETSRLLLAKKSGVDPKVRTLAEEIAAASEEEIDTLTGLRTVWGPAPDGEGGEEAGPGHHGGADGLMSEAQMRELDQLDGPAGQRLYLDGMVAHHQGAAAIAEAEVRDGRDPAALALARQVLARQQAQIAVLQGLQQDG